MVVAIGGIAEARTGAGAPVRLSLSDPVCPGTEITTGARSRIELRFAGADTTTGAASNTTLLIPPRAAGEADVSLVEGLLQFLSSVRGSFTIRTPYQDAGIDGTEAVLAVDGASRQSLILVREGVVRATDRADPSRQLSLTMGKASVAGATRPLEPATAENVPPAFRPLLVNPEGASDWAVYYPPVLLVEGARSAELDRAAALLEAGDIDGAEAALDALPPGAGPRAEAAALSLATVIAVQRNRRGEARDLAGRAVASGGAPATALIARSYAEQAEGRIDTALASARAATEEDPGSAYAWARRAEMELTADAPRAARDSIERSLTIAETALGRTVEGFVALATHRTGAARTAFARAVEIDSRAPLPRLGLGLTAIRAGDVTEGRAELETAVELDPRRASLRTWLGRAYLAEGEAEKATSQFELANREDPDDPTADLFWAFERFEANDPIGALDLIERSAERGERRGTVRSATGLGEDRAVRGVARGRVYDVLGFQELASVTAAEAVDADRSNPGAHLFLADIYRTRPGFEIAQTSEYLKYQLLSPPSKDPIQPELAEADLDLLDTTGPARITFHEFGPVFAGNGLRFDVSGTAGTQDTYGSQGSAVLLHDNVSIGVGQFRTQTNGFRVNNDVRHDVVSAQVKAEVLTGLTLFGEYRYRDTESGDRRLEFGLDEVDRLLRSGLTVNELRLGAHGRITPRTDAIGFVRLVSADEGLLPAGPGALAINNEQEAIDVQAQVIHRTPLVDITAGAGFYAVDNDNTLASVLLPGLLLSDQNSDAATAYIYLDFGPLPWLDVTAGLSVDNYSTDQFGAEINRTRINPKFGLRARVSEDVTLRAAYTRTVQRRRIVEETLEPTTVAGFNQLSFDGFDGLSGQVIQRAGVGIDARLTDDIWAGAEGFLSWRELITRQDARDQHVRGYANVTFGHGFAGSLSVEHRRTNGEDTGPDLQKTRRTTVPLRLRYFHPSGFFAGLDTTYVHYRVTDGLIRRNDDAVVVDAALGYRLPDGRGVLSLQFQNIFDTNVQFADDGFAVNDPSPPLFAREFAVTANVTLRF